MAGHAELPLPTTAAQAAQLQALQAAFAQVCNALAPQVAQSRVWSRVSLHHLHYRALREAFPQLGSQMVCNAIYAVSRTARLVYQHPTSPLHHRRLPLGPLPVLRFADDGPVYFDRHTLSVREGELSLFTLQGRLRLALAWPEQVQQWLQAPRLLEVVLERQARARTEAEAGFVLGFRWASPEDRPEPPSEDSADPQPAAHSVAPDGPEALPGAARLWPAHVTVHGRGPLEQAEGPR